MKLPAGQEGETENNSEAVVFRRGWLGHARDR